MMNWASKLVHDLVIGTNSNTNLSGLTRVGVTQFWNGQTSVDIPLENYGSKSSLENQIHGLPFYENSHEAIPSAGLEKLNQQIGNTTARKRFVLMVTDGEETTASTLEKEAKELHAWKTKCYCLCDWIWGNHMRQLGENSITKWLCLHY